MKTTQAPSAYDQQAADFLKTYGIACTIRRADPHGPGDAPAWREKDEKHGNQYRVALTRTRDGEPSGLPLEFDFWGSINDREKGEDPSAYDVLACLSRDVNCPETFADFCAEYGYDEDSRKAAALHDRCARFARQIQAFFPEGAEREALCEIA